MVLRSLQLTKKADASPASRTTRISTLTSTKAWRPSLKAATRTKPTRPHSTSEATSKKYGFDIDYAPVADVNTNPENIVIGPRAFSDDPETAADFVVSYLNGLDSAGVIGTLKHFPGHGDVKTDTHLGYAETNKTWEEMLQCEMIPFKAGIKAGAQMIMTAHIAAPKITGNDLPATLSSVILQDKLRSELGFKGIIVTDAMDMGAITKQFGNAEAVIKSIQAGVDVVLCSREFTQVFNAVVKAVEKGEIKENRIDESVKRILALKTKK